jgi:signal transduction histidine kinase
MATKRVRRETVTLVTLMVTAVALFSILVPIHAAAYGTALPLALLLGAGVCVAPLVALSRPRLAIAVFCLAAFALPLLVSADRDGTWPWPWSVPALLALVVFVSVVTLRHGWRMGVVPLALSITGSLVAPILRPGAAEAGAASADLIVTASIATGVFVVAVLLAGRIRVGEELSKERELTASEQSRRVLVEERTRIARELHDVIAHSMSLIQVQASTARYRIPELPQVAVAELDDIAAVARQSLTEMRRVLGVLRTEDDKPQLAPQQGLDDVPALVDSIRRAGVEVSLSVAPTPDDLPTSLQITTFRIVQEAVSNAVRHAPGSSIEIAIDPHQTPLTLRVHNSAGGEQTAPGPSGAGHGLRGMQERVTLLGGSLMVGPDPSGGWTVTAVLPWTDTEGDGS